MLAGGGEFPKLIARAVRDSGQKLFVICIQDITDPDIASSAHGHAWVRIGELNKSIQFLKSNGVTRAIMAGRVPHSALFQLKSFDFRAIRLATKMGLGNLRADRVLGVVTEEFNKDGIEIVDSTLFLKSFMPGPGLLTPRCPLRPEEVEWVSMGHRLAKISAAHDIGQTLVVKDGIVVAVEALEGTDSCIRRSGELAGPGIVVVKVSKPNQDLRFDVPVVGRGTIDSLVAAQARLLALSSGKSLLFNREEMIARAEEQGITLLILPESADGNLAPNWEVPYL